MRKQWLKFLQSEAGFGPFLSIVFLSWLFIYAYSGWLVGEIIGFPFLFVVIAVAVGLYPAIAWGGSDIGASFMPLCGVLVAILLVVLPKNYAIWFGTAASLLNIFLFGYYIITNIVSDKPSDKPETEYITTKRIENTLLHFAVKNGDKKETGNL